MECRKTVHVWIYLWIGYKFEFIQWPLGEWVVNDSSCSVCVQLSCSKTIVQDVWKKKTMDSDMKEWNCGTLIKLLKTTICDQVYEQNWTTGREIHVYRLLIYWHMYMKSISFNNNGQKCLFMEIKSGYHVKSKEEKLIEKEIVIYTFQYNV